MHSPSPPRYEEVANLHNISFGELEDPLYFNNTPTNPSAPLLDWKPNVPAFDILNQALRGIENTVCLEKQPGQKDYGPYAFNVRNAVNQALILQGNVTYNYSANIQNLMGRQLLDIINDVYDPVQKFRFRCNNNTIASCEIRSETQTISACKLVNSMENIRYWINIIGEEASDIIIIREGSMSAIAKIHVQQKLGHDNFNCKIVFENPEGSVITIMEKYLVLAFAIAVLIARNGKIQTPEEASNEKCMGYCYGCIVLVVIIIAFAGFIMYLNAKECEWKPSRCRS